MGKIITFGTLKGGVGKTMLCFNIGGILAQLDRRVLVIDSDLQGNLTNNMGIDRTRQDLLTTYDIYRVDNPAPGAPAAGFAGPHLPAASNGHDRRFHLPA